MQTKQELIEDIQLYVFQFNPYWEDPIIESEFVKNTIELLLIVILLKPNKRN